MKPYRHQAVVPVAVFYVIVLLCLSLAAPLRAAKHLLQKAIQGSGKVVKESRSVSQFKAVDVSGVGEVTATTGSKPSLSIEADDNILPLLETEVKNDCLFISVKSDSNIRPSKPIRYSITTGELNRIDCSGAIKTSIGKLRTDGLVVKASGVCSTTMSDVECKQLDANVSGASKIQISGKSPVQKVNLSGVSNYDANGLASKSVDIEASGASKAFLLVTDHLKADASGVSSVRYKGSPKVTASTSGVASVKAQ